MNNASRPFFQTLAAVALALPCGSVPAASSAVVDSPFTDTFVLRAQVMEGANLARSLLTCIADEYAYGLFGATCQADGISGNYVDYIGIENGRIDITYGKRANVAIAGQTLSLTPYKMKDGHVAWRCGNRPKPPGLKTLWPAATVYQASTLDDLYASAACDAVTGFPDRAAYRRDVLRDRIGQGIRLAGRAKRQVEEAATTPNALQTAAAIFNAQANGTGSSSSHVNSIQIGASNGAITITFNPNSMGIAEQKNLLVMTPFLHSADGSSVSLEQALGAGQTGPVHWACTSTIGAVAAAGDDDSPIGCELMGAFAEVATVYPEDVVRGYIRQGLQLADRARSMVEEFGASTELLAALASTFNRQAGGLGLTNPYVTSVQIEPFAGVITITYNETETGIATGENTIALSPFVYTGLEYPDTILDLGSALAGGLTGAIVWGCASQTAITVTSQGMATAWSGTLQSKYAPLECR